jgi:3-hydroxyacyl-CoA dehydrogenase
MARLRTTTELQDLADCDFVIEAAFEDLDVKQRLFQELEGVVRDDAILATNTSALSVTQIASVLARPERAVGMHFLQPGAADAARRDRARGAHG